MIEEIMEKPNYVLKSNEGVWQDVNYNPTLEIVKKIIWLIIIAIIIGSIIFQTNIFGELALGTRLVFIAMAICVFTRGKKERVPSPFEIWFYD